MGQRSQIYLRYDNNAYSRDDKPEEDRGLIAQYYPWNYGERMISRAAHTLDYIASMARELNSTASKAVLIATPQKIGRIMDVNFDMMDVAISSDIIEEYKDFRSEDFRRFAFDGQDSNDGKLFIDVQGSTIKYAFTDDDISKPMTAREYMKWGKYTKYLDEDELTALNENFKTIAETAELMTPEELEAFLSYDYSKEMERHGIQLLKTTQFTIADGLDDVVPGWDGENGAYLDVGLNLSPEDLEALVSRTDMLTENDIDTFEELQELGLECYAQFYEDGNPALFGLILCSAADIPCDVCNVILTDTEKEQLCIGLAEAFEEKNGKSIQTVLLESFPEEMWEELCKSVSEADLQTAQSVARNNLDNENYESKVGFEYNGAWIINPWVDESARAELSDIEALAKYGVDNIRKFCELAVEAEREQQEKPKKIERSAGNERE